MGIKDGAILHGDCLSVRNDGGECGGMPHHRVPLGIELAGRGWMSPSAKLLLTTGFCGGFTTFSTFMNEGAGLMKEENYLYMMLYLFGSLALGLIAVLAGHYLAKIIA